MRRTMAWMFVGLAAAMAPQVGSAQDASAAIIGEPPPFSGAHSTEWIDRGGAMAGTAIAAPGVADSTRNYIGLDLLYLKQDSAEDKIPLFELISNGVSADQYRLGATNTNFMPGFRWVLGRHASESTSFEVGGMYVHPFFYKRTYDSITTTGGSFGGPVTNQTVFLPNPTNLQHTHVSHRVGHYGFEGNAKLCLLANDRLTVDGIAGLRFHRIFERMFIDVQRRADGPTANESFHSGNCLFGPQIGARAQWQLVEYLALRGDFRYMFGWNWQSLDIGGPESGGFFTGPTNIGSFEKTRFGDILDFGVHAVAQLTPNIDFTIGFTALYFGTVQRSPNSVQPLFVGLAEPVAEMPDDSLWLYGVQAGITIQY